MKIETAGELLEEKTGSPAICSPGGTPIHRAAEEIIEMARAYLSDGGSFLKSGDAVNALASYAYGLGWMDAGIDMGIISSPGNEEFMTLSCDEEIPGSLHDHLEEKTGRYHRMLESAIGSVVPAPDRESPLFPAAGKITNKAKSHLKEGIGYEDNKKLSPALWHFSYGYGWLDAGVRCGLLAITGDRTLFTV